jgi:hypothetical protein
MPLGLRGITGGLPGDYGDRKRIPQFGLPGRRVACALAAPAGLFHYGGVATRAASRTQERTQTIELA